MTRSTSYFYTKCPPLLESPELPPRRSRCRARHLFDPQPDDDDGDGAFSSADWAPAGVFVGGAVGLGRCWRESEKDEISDRISPHSRK